MVVSVDASPGQREAIDAELAGSAEVTYLDDLDPSERAAAVAGARALLAFRPAQELGDEGREAARRLELVQLISAGWDHLERGDVPPAATVAANVGAFAEPMAEHTVAMALALAKRLGENHKGLREDEWNQEPTRELRGGVCGVLGFGGIGRAVAALVRPMGMAVHAINTSGQTDEPVDFVGTLDDLDRVLAAADLLVIALPLDGTTRGLIGARELATMKEETILVNVARGEIVDQDALYEHLRANPGFLAGLDAWWVEPLRHGEFRLDHPFLELANVLGSPHNSGVTPRTPAVAAGRAAANVARFLEGDQPHGVIDRSAL